MALLAALPMLGMTMRWLSMSPTFSAATSSPLNTVGSSRGWRAWGIRSGIVAWPSVTPWKHLGARAASFRDPQDEPSEASRAGKARTSSIPSR